MTTLIIINLTSRESQPDTALKFYFYHRERGNDPWDSFLMTLSKFDPKHTRYASARDRRVVRLGRIWPGICFD